MELKRDFLAAYNKGLRSLNRTFMELKSKSICTCFTARECLNRTFMELKLGICTNGFIKRMS